jgi:hypothetical protein
MAVTPLSARTVTRLYAFALISLGVQPDWICDPLANELMDGPLCLINLIERGVIGFASAINESGLHLLLVALTPDGKVMVRLMDADPRRLGITDEETASLTEYAEQVGLVDIETPDTPEGLEDAEDDEPPDDAA